MKFCLQLGDTQLEKVENIRWAFTNAAMSTMYIQEWYNRCKDGQTSVESNEWSGRPLTNKNPETVEKVHQLPMEDHRIIIKRMKMKWRFHLVQYNQSLLVLVPTDNLCMHHVATKFVP